MIKKTYSIIALAILFLVPQVYMAIQVSDEEKKYTEIYESFIKLKNNFNDDKFWNNAEIYKNKQKMKYDEFDEVKKILVKQIICRTCKISLDKIFEEIEKDKKNYKELSSKIKNALKELDDMEKKLKINLYEIKPDWFTDLDKEIFLEIKK